MIKRLKALFPALLFSILGMAQVEHDHKGNVPCNQAELTNKFLKTGNEIDVQKYLESREELKAFREEFVANYNPQFQAKSVSYTIPVVFHILHANGTENISDAQIYDAMEVLNRDYQKLNSDTIQVVDFYKNNVADMKIQFKLAKLDPQGNCTNGITRTYAPNIANNPDASGNQRVQAVINEHGIWPGDKYLNIFVAGNIGGAAGYTYLPNDWLGSNMTNGIHILNNYIGSIGTSALNRSRALTHECGHWFDLPHLWGPTNSPGVADNCSEDDGIEDTPNTIGWTTCNLSGTTCDGILDNVQNFMEYSYCSSMFTNGQKARAHAALNSSTGGRNNLYTVQNLIETGVNEEDQLCKTDFGASESELCIGEEVTFTDFSYTTPTSWSWTFEGGTPTTSTEQNPTVVYNQPGSHDVTLTVSDGTSTISKVKDNFITINSNYGTLPFLETFQNVTNIPSENWSELNNNGVNWTISSNIGYDDNKSARLANFLQSADEVDELISQTMDLSNLDANSEMTLSFRYAYAKKNPNNSELLKVYVSSDCGDNWAPRQTLHGNNLGEHYQSTPYKPVSQDEWVTVHMTNITSQFYTSNFRVKFRFTSDGGNNLYIDNINIYEGSPSNELVLGLDGLEEGILTNDFGVYPNPTEGEINVRFTSAKNMDAKVDVLNMVGQVIRTENINAAVGTNLVQMQENNLNTGVYFVRLTTNGITQTKQIIIK